MRISAEARNTITVYATDKDVRLDLADMCNSIDEVDALALCLYTIEQAKPVYTYSQYSAPKYPARRTKAFNELIANLAPYEQAIELEYINQQEHLISQTQAIKRGVTRTITAILQDVGIGKKRRYLMLPLLIETLKDTDN